MKSKKGRQKGNRPKDYSWNAFTQDGQNQRSESERKYNQSLESKYKWLKVSNKRKLAIVFYLISDINIPVYSQLNS